MGLGEAAQGAAVGMAIMIAVGYGVVALVVSLLMRWLAGTWKATIISFAAFASLAALFVWLGGADSRAEAERLEAAYALSDPIWEEIGVTPPRSAHGFRKKACGEATTYSLFTGEKVPDRRKAISTAAGRLRTDGWEVIQPLYPKSRDPWVYAHTGNKTLIVWHVPSDRPASENVIKIEARLGDCDLLSVPTGTVEDPNCARGGWQNCTKPGRLIART